MTTSPSLSATRVSPATRLARIGTRAEAAEGGIVQLDVDLLVHMLLAASSGFGKTTALLRILEELLRLDIQVVILDVEGDFVMLREMADFALIGPDGEAAVDVSSARTLARLVREHRFNLIVDLSDEAPKIQREWTAEFANGLSHLPRALWGPMVLVVDEGDTLAPQKQKRGQPVASQEALVNLASRGRKRGIKMLVATQRLAKLDMDVRGECADKLIGHFNASADRKAAVEDLAAVGSAGMQDAIARLAPGDFYAFGRSLHLDDAVRVRVELPNTQPPPKGAAARPAPPPRAKVKKLLSEVLAGLPSRAAEEAATLEEAKHEIERLEKRVRELARATPDPSAGARAGPEAARLKDELREARTQLAALHREHAARERQWEAWQMRVDKTLARLAGEAAVAHKDAVDSAPAPVEAAPGLAQAATTRPAPVNQKPRPPRAFGGAPSLEGDSDDVGAGAAAPLGELSGTQQRILDRLAELLRFGHEEVDRAMLAAYAQTKSPRSSTFRNALGALQSAGLVDVPRGGPVKLTTQGAAVAQPRPRPTSGKDLLDDLQLQASQRRLLEALLEAYPKKVARDELAGKAGHGSARSSTFRNALGALHTRALVEVHRGGPPGAAEWLYDLLEQLGGWR